MAATEINRAVPENWPTLQAEEPAGFGDGGIVGALMGGIGELGELTDVHARLAQPAGNEDLCVSKPRAPLARQAGGAMCGIKPTQSRFERGDILRAKAERRERAHVLATAGQKRGTGAG